MIDVEHSSVTVFESLLPATVCVQAEANLASALPLSASELEASTRFSSIRLADFQKGRSCARRALVELDCSEHSVAMGSLREPIWPAGITGSITHTDGEAVAALAKTSALRSIGIDMEVSGQIDDDLARRICTEDERTSETAARMGQPYFDLIFSAKESVYKCIFPFVERFVDFDEVRLHIDVEARAFGAEALTENLAAALLATLRGRWSITDSRVRTTAVIV